MFNNIDTNYVESMAAWSAKMTSFSHNKIITW